MSTARTTELTQSNKLGAYISLTKPDVSFLVLMTTGTGFYMGARGPIDWLHMLHVVFGTMMIAAGTAALNHYIERESDRYMRRTASRPLPTGQLTPAEALRFGVVLSIAGAIDLYFVAGYLACLLGVVTSVSYLLAYTPLKKRTVWATFIGAIPGAIPPMIGWTAATGKLDAGAWLLFAILFFLAVPALPRDFLDVPRRLRPGRNSDAAGRRQGRHAYVSTNRSLCRHTRGCEPAARHHGLCRRALFLWGPGHVHRAGASLPLGCARQNE